MRRPPPGEYRSQDPESRNTNPPVRESLTAPNKTKDCRSAPVWLHSAQKLKVYNTQLSQKSLTMPANEPKPTGEIVLYQTADGNTRVECRFADENIWLSQALMAELFQTTPQNITLHLRAIYDEGELAEQATCKDYLQVRTEGARTVGRQVEHYSLEMIMAVERLPGSGGLSILR